MKCTEYIPEIVPVLIPVLKDDTPAVARQAIRCGMEIFRSILFKVALQVSENFKGANVDLKFCSLTLDDLDLVNWLPMLCYLHLQLLPSFILDNS